MGAAGVLRKTVYRERVTLPQKEQAVHVDGWWSLPSGSGTVASVEIAIDPLGLLDGFSSHLMMCPLRRRVRTRKAWPLHGACKPGDCPQAPTLCFASNSCMKSLLCFESLALSFASKYLQLSLGLSWAFLHSSQRRSSRALGSAWQAAGR